MQGSRVRQVGVVLTRRHHGVQQKKKTKVNISRAGLLISVVDPNTGASNLDTDPEFLPNLDTDPRGLLGL